MRFWLACSSLVVIVGMSACGTTHSAVDIPTMTSTSVEPPSTVVDLSWMNPASSTTTSMVPSTTIAASPPEIPVTEAVVDGTVWDELAFCESGGDWSYPPVAGGFSGGLMFHVDTWVANGGGEFADDAWLASRDEQIVVAVRVQERQGWSAWPGCSRKLGLR